MRNLINIFLLQFSLHDTGLVDAAKSISKGAGYTTDTFCADTLIANLKQQNPDLSSVYSSPWVTSLMADLSSHKPRVSFGDAPVLLFDSYMLHRLTMLNYGNDPFIEVATNEPLSFDFNALYEDNKGQYNVPIHEEWVFPFIERLNNFKPQNNKALFLASIHPDLNIPSPTLCELLEMSHYQSGFTFGDYIHWYLKSKAFFRIENELLNHDVSNEMKDDLSHASVSNDTIDVEIKKYVHWLTQKYCFHPYHYQFIRKWVNLQLKEML